MTAQVPDPAPRAAANIEQQLIDAEAEIARLRRELAEGVARETATSEILRVISSSPTELQPVLEAVADNAVRLTGADGGSIHRVQDGLLQRVASSNAYRNAQYSQVAGEGQPLNRDWVTGRAVVDRQIIHVHDLAAAGDEFPLGRTFQAIHQRRTILAVPLLRDDQSIGVITVSCFEVSPFTNGQIELVKAFAHQAVIAIENTRLFQELRESLEQQTSTSEILRVIATSPTELQSVLDAVAESAAGLCGGVDAQIFRVEGNMLRKVATHGSLPVNTSVGEAGPINRHNSTGCAVLERRTIHIPDVAADAASEFSGSLARARQSGFRALLAVPMLREQVVIGVILTRRMEAGPFTEKQIRLLETFADQAVIAIENTRLFQELETRNRDLAESLEQQTATSEILRAIASSPNDLQPVLDAVAERAARLCDTDSANIRLVESDHLRLVAGVGHFVSTVDQIKIDRARLSGRAVLEGRAIHVEDLANQVDEFPNSNLFQQIGGTRTQLAMPLLRDGVAIGLITLRRQVVRPFTMRQIALLQTFADQAVIAIENTRLFQELQDRNQDLQESNRQVTEALEQQTATAEVLRVIASSPTDLPAVLEVLAANAARICGGDDSLILQVEGDLTRLIAQHGDLPAPLQLGGTLPLVPDSLRGQVISRRQSIQIADANNGDDLLDTRRHLRDLGLGAMLGTPLLREGQAIGYIGIRRREAGAFNARQIAMLEAFADQAVIAIENTRLFQELQSRTTELAELNQTLEARVDEQVTELERVGRLRRYLSPQLADLIVSSGDESMLESHRRQITVVFCDLRGFTAFAETAEPEEVMGVLGEYHAALGELVHRFGGTIEHFAGDGLLVFFNDPVPQPDHAERAVRMAVAMRERVGELARSWRRQGHELGFGVGIAMGYATLGRIGFEGRFDYAAIGTVTNLAARLSAEAAHGQILISGRVHGAVENLIEAEELAELTLKGFHRAVATVNVSGLRGQTASGAPW